MTPTLCKYCRNIKRENWNNHRRTNTRVDIDGKPVREVTDFTMAAVEPTYEPSIYDDGDAMADYASGFFSYLMITVDLEEVISEDYNHISHMRRSPVPIERHGCREYTRQVAAQSMM